MCQVVGCCQGRHGRCGVTVMEQLLLLLLLLLLCLVSGLAAA
jgi:hypothetical protein